MEKRNWPKPVLVVSQCLGFDPVRYDGEMIDEPLVRQLKGFVHWLPVCPEVAIGLGVPRDPIHLEKDGEHVRLFQSSTQRDLTAPMQSFALKFLASLPAVDGFILKARSPSCGPGNVKRFDTQNNLLDQSATGLFAAEVLNACPAIPVADETMLQQKDPRDNFLTKVFLLAAFREARESGLPSALIEFHRRNKFWLLAQDEQGSRLLGALVGGISPGNISQVFNEYENRLNQLLPAIPTRKAHYNSILHTFGFLSDKLSAAEKTDFLEKCEIYLDDGAYSLETLKGLIQQWITRFQETDLSEQTYFNPYPAELRDAIRNS